jgi:hypothetical protein
MANQGNGFLDMAALRPVIEAIHQGTELPHGIRLGMEM